MAKFEYYRDEPRTFPSIVIAKDDDGNTLSAISVDCEQGTVVDAPENPDPAYFREVKSAPPAKQSTGDS